MVSHRGGVRGRTWRLPSTEPEASRRQTLLGLLGLGEKAVAQVPDSGDPRRVLVNAELSKEERVWLDSISQALGLSSSATASRVIRVLVRALIRNRDLLPVAVEFDDETQPWLTDLERDASIADRLRPLVDSLPDKEVRALLVMLEESLAARKSR